MSRVILVTGISRALGARFARTLASRPDVDVIGVDVTPPRHDIGEAHYHRADIRNARIGRMIAAEQVETVVHLAMASGPSGSGGRSVMKELNVIGTMQVLAACQRSEIVRRFVAQSSAMVYGASPRDPARFTEEMTARVEPRSGYGRDSIEIESYVGGLARRRPDLTVTTLRLADLLGPHVDTPLARYLSLPVVPRPMGYDARMQFLHPDDAVAALLRACDLETSGTFNVAADDFVTLTQALALLDRPSIPVPAHVGTTLQRVGRQFGIELSSDEVAALTYGRGMDVSRFAEVAGFRAAHSSRAAVEEFAAQLRPSPMPSSRITSVITRTTDRLNRKVGDRG
jgi:UDP-glucose 4-epimerase